MHMLVALSRSAKSTSTTLKRNLSPLVPGLKEGRASQDHLAVISLPAAFSSSSLWKFLPSFCPLSVLCLDSLSLIYCYSILSSLSLFFLPCRVCMSLWRRKGVQRRECGREEERTKFRKEHARVSA